MPDLASTLAKLPPRCFARLPSTGETIAVVRGEPGYHPVIAFATPERLNAALPEPPTADQVEAMLAGSMFGWGVPGADPDRVRASRAPPPCDGQSLAGLLLPGDMTATRTGAGVVLRDGAGEEIASLPPDHTPRDVRAWVNGYVAGGSWGYVQGKREGLALARRWAPPPPDDPPPPPAPAPSEPADPPAVAEWGGPDAPFRLDGCPPIRPGTSPTLDRLWTRAGSHLGYYGWLRITDRRAKTVCPRGLCDLPERDWHADYAGRVPPDEAVAVAIDEHAAEPGTGQAPAHGHAPHTA